MDRPPNLELEAQISREPVLVRLRGDLRARRWEAAFAAAEQWLDGPRTQLRIETLAGALRAIAKDELSTAPLNDLVDLAAPGRDPWATFFLVCAHDGAGRYLEANEAVLRLEGVPKRYGWMRFWRGSYVLQFLAELDAAEIDFQAAADSAPKMWKARAYMAELALCRGNAAAAFELFDAIVKTLRGPSLAEARAWRGALRLWNGDYGRALTDLDAAADAGAPFARGWRGAALFKLGRRVEARRELDAGLAESASDDETRTWRAELNRAEGRHDAALAELADILGPNKIRNFWPLANRALSHFAKGDFELMARDFSLIDPDIRGFLRDATGAASEEAPSAPVMKALLEAGLSMGRGLRRADTYLQHMWLRADRKP